MGNLSCFTPSLKRDNNPAVYYHLQYMVIKYNLFCCAQVASAREEVMTLYLFICGGLLLK